MKHFILFGIVSLLVSMIPSMSFAETRWDMPAPGGQNRVQTKILASFIEDASNRSSSALQITLHPGETLIRQNDTLDALKSNIVSIGAMNADSVLRSYLDIDAGILALTPQSYDKARALYNTIKPALVEALAKDNLVVLASVPHMAVGIFSTRPLHSIHELRRQYFSSTENGLDFFARYMDSPLSDEPANDIPAGKFNYIFSDALSSKPYELPAKGIGYFYDIKLLVPYDLLLVRKNALESLPDSERRALMDAAATLETQGWETVKNEEIAAIGLLKQNAVKVIPAASGIGLDFKMMGDTLAAEHQSLWREKGIQWP